MYEKIHHAPAIKVGHTIYLSGLLTSLIVSIDAASSQIIAPRVVEVAPAQRPRRGCSDHPVRPWDRSVSADRYRHRRHSIQKIHNEALVAIRTRG